MSYNILLRKKYFAMGFVVLSTVYYSLQGSNLDFSYSKILLFLALTFGLTHSLLVKRQINRKAYLVFISLACCILIKLMISTDTRLFFAFIAVFIGMQVSEKEIYKWMYLTKLICVMLVVVTGGYSHQNSLALHGGITLLLYIVYREDQFNKNDWFYVLSAYILLCLYTKAGALIVSMGVTIVLLFFLLTIGNMKSILQTRCVTYVFLITFLANIGLVLLVDPDKPANIFVSFANMIDALTSSRLQLAKFSLQVFGVSFFGNNIDYSLIDFSKGYYHLDSGMMWLLQEWGIFITIPILEVLRITMLYFNKNKRYCSIIAGIAIALWAMNEDILMSIGTNFLFFSLGAALHHGNEHPIKEKLE